MMGWLKASIRRVLAADRCRRARRGRGNRILLAAAPRTGHAARRRRATPKRVARRPDPGAWSEDELLALHEAVALLWPRGPVTVSTLRTAIAAGELAHARIAGRIYTTRAALAAMAACRRAPGANRGAGTPDGTDWDAHLAALLPKRSGRGGEIGPGHRD